jgi:hypothetical protein
MRPGWTFTHATRQALLHHYQHLHVILRFPYRESFTRSRQTISTSFNPYVSTHGFIVPLPYVPSMMRTRTNI